MEFVISNCGTKINKCCASCAFKVLNGISGKRECTKSGCQVNPFDVCDDWQIRKALKRVGRKKGLVKRKSYLMFVLKTRLMEYEAIVAKTIKVSDLLTAKQLRAKFENTFYLSPYIGKK